MSNNAVEVEHVSKMYRLGLVGARTLQEDVTRLWAKLRGKPDPFLRFGEADPGESVGSNDYIWALRDVNLEVTDGEILGIIGPNGAGKSTLLKLLSRVTAPTTGRLRCWGRIASLLEVGTGFHQELTGRENIYLNGAILGMTRREVTSLLDEIVDFSLSLGSLESVRWKGADGWEMQGFLILPPKSDFQAPCPLVTNVHGGPTFAYGCEYYVDSRWFQQLAVQGIGVFLPNPRGSTGRGLAFAESNIGDMGGKDWEDIQKGIDALIDRGVADPRRLGISGGSYGGYMTAWAVTQDRSLQGSRDACRYLGLAQLPRPILPL